MVNACTMYMYSATIHTPTAIVDSVGTMQTYMYMYTVHAFLHTQTYMYMYVIVRQCAISMCFSLVKWRLMLNLEIPGV